MWGRIWLKGHFRPHSFFRSYTTTGMLNQADKEDTGSSTRSKSTMNLAPCPS